MSARPERAPSAAPRRRTAWLAALLVAAAAASHAPALGADFIHFDDPQYLLENPHVHTGLRWENLRWAFTHEHLSNWHPLTWLSHMLDFEVFGSDPAGHHAVGVALHAVNVLLLFALLAGATRQTVPSALAAAIFALHPVNVESVAWVTQRKTTLSTLFALLSILAYVRYARAASRRAYAASLALFALSLLSKQLWVTLPFALLLLDAWPLRRLAPESAALREQARAAWRRVPEKLPYLLLAAAASAVTLVVQQGAMATVESFPIGERIANTLVAYVRYVASFFWPAHLAVFHPRDPGGVGLARAAAAAAGLLAATVAILRLDPRWRPLQVGWLWFLGTMIPMSGLVQVGDQARADRYAYVPFWGLAIALVWSGRELLRTRPRLARPALALALVACAALAAATARQAQRWRDTITLFEDALAHTEHNWLAHRTLAAEYFAAGDYGRAREHCERALALQRDLGAVLATCGLTMYELGSTARAIEMLEQGTRAAPDDPTPLTHLGWVYAELGRDESAEAVLAAAAQRLPETANAHARLMVHGNRARVLARLGRLDEARREHALAQAADPASPLLLPLAAEIDFQAGDLDAASSRVQAAVEQRPDDADAWDLLARIQARRAAPEEAAAAWRRTLALEPRRYEAVMRAAELERRLGRPGEARRILEEGLAAAREATGDDRSRVRSTFERFLADLALEEGEPGRARERYERALAEWPENHAAHRGLAWLLATAPASSAAEVERAVALAERACALAPRREPRLIATLAAAYARSGRSEEAVRTAREALALAIAGGDSALAGDIERQLAVYAAGSPYLEP
jgi:tetratricopeptide (TPR) repeat protein